MKEYSMIRVLRVGAWGVLIGGAAGFALGVLLAPEEGQTVRRRLVYRLEHLASQAGQLVDHLIKQQSGNEARRTGDALVADARARAQRIRKDIDQLLDEMRRQNTPQTSNN
jgi:gas vesicle protein